MLSWYPLVLFGPAAFAWEPQAVRPIAVPEGITAIAAGDWHGPTLLALTGDGIHRIDVNTGFKGASGAIGGEDLLLTDLDGNGSRELLVCGPKGIHIARGTADGFGEPIRLAEAPCRRIARLDRDGVAQLVTVGTDSITRWTPGPAGLVATRVADWAGDAPLLRSQGARFAVADLGKPSIQDHSSLGSSSLATGGPVNAIAFGPQGLIWAVAEGLIDITHQRHPADARALLGADLDNDGDNEVLVAHPDARLSVLGGNAFSSGATLDRLVAADLNGDGCIDLAGTGPGGGSVMFATCGAPAVAAAPPAPQPQPEPEPEPEPTGPEVPGPGRIVVLQKDVSATANARVGEPFKTRLEDDRRRAYTYIVASEAPRGLRMTKNGTVRFTPTDDQVGQHQIDVRMRLWGVVPQRRSFTLDVHPETVRLVQPEPSQMTRRRPTRRAVFSRCSTGLGAAAAATDNSNNWQNLGGPPVLLAASPALSLSCDGRAPAWFAGVDSAPAAYYAATSTRDFHHVLATHIGLQVGKPVFRVGVFTTFGLVLVGGGARVQWMPFEDRHGRRRGVTLRATGLGASASAGEAMVLYTTDLGRFRRQKAKGGVY